LEFKLLESFENGDMLLRRIDSLVMEVRKAEKGTSGETVKADAAKTESPKTGDKTPVNLTDSADTDLFAEMIRTGRHSGSEKSYSLVYDEENHVVRKRRKRPKTK